MSEVRASSQPTSYTHRERERGRCGATVFGGRAGGGGSGVMGRS